MCSETETALLKFYGLAISQRPFLRWMDRALQPCSATALSSLVQGRRGLSPPGAAREATLKVELCSPCWLPTAAFTSPNARTSAAHLPGQPTAAVQRVTASGVPSPPPKPPPSASPGGCHFFLHSPNFASCPRMNCNFLGPSPFSTYPLCLAGDRLMLGKVFGARSPLLLLSQRQNLLKAPN